VAAHGKPRRLVPVVLALFVVAAAAGCGSALSGSRAPHAVMLDNASVASIASVASGQQVTVSACLSAGKLTRVSLTVALKCPAHAVRARWSARSGPAPASGHGAVYACLSAGELTRVSVTAALKCPAHAVRARWSALSGPAVAAARSAVLYACLAAGKLTRVSVTAGPKCPAHSVEARWAALPGPVPAPRSLPRASASASPSPSSSPSPVASPSPSSGSPSPSTSAPTTPAPDPTGQGARCVTSATMGSCGPYNYPQISASGGGTTVTQDVWNPIAGASQTLTAYNPGDWSVTADMPAGNGAVVSYPDIKQLYTTTSNTPDPLSDFKSITSSFAESGPGSGGGDDYEAAYDIWAGTGSDDYAQEIMIWVDTHGQIPAGSKAATADIGGTSYTVWSANDHPVSLVLDSNETSGTINILAALDWLMSHGYMPAGSGLNQIDFGWEICSTGGTAKTFRLTEYGIQSS